MKILKSEKESFPGLKLIGKKYADGRHWGEWWENGWFEILEGLSPAKENGDAYIGAMRIVNGQMEYWIGMFFPPSTVVPEGFESVLMEAKDYAIFYQYGNPENGELYGLDAHNACLEIFPEKGWVRSEDDWCFERYNCPRFTEPDEKGNVILDYGISLA